MAGERTCGEGLAGNAALPAKLADVIAAVGRVLENHTKALDLDDDSGRQEYDAYLKLVDEHRRMSAELHSLAEAMASYRDLPMGRHDLEVLSSRDSADVFEQLVTEEQELLSLLEERRKQHRPLLSELRRGGASGDPRE